MKTFIILIALAISHAGFGQEALKFHGSVKLSISGEESIKNEITSFMSRELRELSDVTVVDENPDWEISVVAMESHLKSGQKTGFVISVVLFQHYNPKVFDILFDKKHAEVAKNLMTRAVIYLDHWLRSGSTEELKTVCQGLVADFDSKHLAEARKLRDLINQVQEQQKKK
jgi:hypothetical protein